MNNNGANIDDRDHLGIDATYSTRQNEIFLLGTWTELRVDQVQLLPNVVLKFVEVDREVRSTMRKPLGSVCYSLFFGVTRRRHT